MERIGSPPISRPHWLTVRALSGRNYLELHELMRTQSLHTVCEEARCPNIFECWEHRTATFMILGSICTRACRFCAVTSGRPTELDLAEPERVAETVQQMKLRHAVITSVARDDLVDGGASLFASTITAIRSKTPMCGVEVLIPDFQGDWHALGIVLDAKPDILNHNIETVERLSKPVRGRARYDRSLALLSESKRISPSIPTKSSLMVGLGETMEELLVALRDLRERDCDIVTIGQYLQPTPSHLPVARYVEPQEFNDLKQYALELGFHHVEAGPLVRSSYHAHEQVIGAGYA